MSCARNDVKLRPTRYAYFVGVVLPLPVVGVFETGTVDRSSNCHCESNRSVGRWLANLSTKISTQTDTPNNSLRINLGAGAAVMVRGHSAQVHDRWYRRHLKRRRFGRTSSSICSGSLVTIAAPHRPQTCCSRGNSQRSSTTGKWM